MLWSQGKGSRDDVSLRARRQERESGVRGQGSGEEGVRLKLSPCGNGDVPTGCQNLFPATCSFQKAPGHQEAVPVTSGLHPGFPMSSSSCLDFPRLLGNVSQVWVSFPSLPGKALSIV